jgi:hypothetical protein
VYVRGAGSEGLEALKIKRAAVWPEPGDVAAFERSLSNFCA